MNDKIPSQTEVESAGFSPYGTSLTVTLSMNSKLVQSQAGFYRMTIGDISVTALSDGTVGLQILDGLLLNAKSGEVEKLLAYNYQIGLCT